MRCPATSPGGSGFVFRVCLRGLGAVSERPLSDSRRGLARLSVNAARCAEAVIEGVDRATAERRATLAIWQRPGDPSSDAQALPQFVGSPECPLPWPFVLAGVGELIAMSAQKIAARAVKLGDAASAISTVSRSRADEIGAAAAESTMQMDDGDGFGHVWPFSIPDPHSVGKT